MATKTKFLIGTLALPAVLLLTVAFNLESGALSASSFMQGNPSSDLPIVDYEMEVGKPKSKERTEKSNHFKGRANPDSKKPIDELPEGIEPLPISGHWWVGLSALPVDRSDVVLRGIIGSSEAHLSSDKTGIYSECSILVSEVFKDSTKTITSGNPIAVNRIGGAVRFKSGKIQKYGIAGQGMPRVGSQYVLFLRKTEDGDFLILTGYELLDGSITPIDGEGNKDPRMDLPFKKYRGADQTQFLKDLDDAIRASGGPH